MSKPNTILDAWKNSHKGTKRMIWMVAIMTLLVTVGIGSSLLLDADNLIEEKTEQFLEDMLEEELLLPDDFLDGRIDFSPFTPELINAQNEEDFNPPADG